MKRRINVLKKRRSADAIAFRRNCEGWLKIENYNLSMGVTQKENVMNKFLKLFVIILTAFLAVIAVLATISIIDDKDWINGVVLLMFATVYALQLKRIFKTKTV